MSFLYIGLHSLSRRESFGWVLIIRRLFSISLASLDSSSLEPYTALDLMRCKQKIRRRFVLMEGEVIDILHICSAITAFGFANYKHGGA